MPVGLHGAWYSNINIDIYIVHIVRRFTKLYLHFCPGAFSFYKEAGSVSGC